MRFKFGSLVNWTPIKVGEPGSGQVRLRQQWKILSVAWTIY